MSHRAFSQLTSAGFSDEQTEALFEVYGGGRDSFVTKDDLKPLATKIDLQPFATKDDLQRFATKNDLQSFATKDDLQRFATKDDLQPFATKDDLQRFATKDDLQGGLQGLELRLTLRFGALVVAGVAALAVLDRF